MIEKLETEFTLAGFLKRVDIKLKENYKNDINYSKFEKTCEYLNQIFKEKGLLELRTEDFIKIAYQYNFFQSNSSKLSELSDLHQEYVSKVFKHFISSLSNVSHTAWDNSKKETAKKMGLKQIPTEWDNDGVYEDFYNSATREFETKSFFENGRFIRAALGFVDLNN